MGYFYCQKEGGNEGWKLILDTDTSTASEYMFKTILSLDTDLGQDATREQIADTKYKGPLYFDMDDAESPASTAKDVVKLIDSLSKLDVEPSDLLVYASGGKGFHVIVDERIFLVKPPRAGIAMLPAIYKEIAFKVAVASMDFAVYSGRKGRMFRQANIQRPNNLYKVQISIKELEEIADADVVDAEQMYREICSAPRPETFPDVVFQAAGLMALFDISKVSVTKSAARRKKIKPVVLPKLLPSFDAMLEGRGIKPDAGFHQIALQVCVTAHQQGLSAKDLVEKAEGLIQSHDSDGYRYNTPEKRRQELYRMWEYTYDNPCYDYSGKAISALLTHRAPDLHGLEVEQDEIEQALLGGDIEDIEGGEYDHAGIIMTRKGAFIVTEHGPKQVTAVTFDNVTELLSTEKNQLSVIEADVYVGGRMKGRDAFTLETFQSSGNLNKLASSYGQIFNGNDNQARGMYLRMVEKARQKNQTMYVIAREGLDYVQIPFHEDPEIKEGFLVWSDSKQVVTQDSVADKISLRFVGWPDDRGQFQTDLGAAEDLVPWLQIGDNKEEMRTFLKNLLGCQKPSTIGKLLGWTTACHYRMVFHRMYGQFPLMHINGPGGMGKCLRKGTLVIMADGTRKKIEDVAVGEQLLGPDGTVRNVLDLGRGREVMYEVTPTKGKPYYVNENHILSPKRSGKGGCYLADGTHIPATQQVLNVTVKTLLASAPHVQDLFRGYRSESVEFIREQEALPIPAYILGVWLGDGDSSGPSVTKPQGAMVEAWKEYATSIGMRVSCYQSKGKCDKWAIVDSRHGTNIVTKELMSLNLINNKHIPESYLYAPAEERLKLIAGLLDSDGHQTSGGYDWISKCPKLAEDFVFLCRSVGLAAYSSEVTKGIKSTGFSGKYYRVGVSGDCERIPCLDKKAPPRLINKNHLVVGLKFKRLEEEDYYGVVLDGDHLFLLGDFTVTHNTQMTLLFSAQHYYKEEAKMLSPTSTLFAVANSISSSSSIPLVLDEFKPSEMPQNVYDKFKLMMRDSYNCRTVERGGGSRDNADYRSTHRVELSAPVCFIAEAVESEPALMERVVLLTLTKPDIIKTQAFHKKFVYAQQHKHMLGIIGKFITASTVKKYDKQTLDTEFTEVLNITRKEMMLQEGEIGLSTEEYRRKSTAKERTVFNYAVARFGLQKFRAIIKSIYEDEFEDLFQEMFETLTDSAVEVQEQTTPEWLKVMNTFAEMAVADELSPFHMKANREYAFVEFNGKACFEMSASVAYFKYRLYCAASRTRPLFPSVSAFSHTLNSLSALEAKNHVGALNSPSGSHLFSLEALRQAGFITPQAR